jgi:hypothetical protein
MVLVDVLEGDQWFWLRFTLEGGAGSRVASVSWERGPITTFVQEESGKDLRVIVQIPRAPVNKRTRLRIEIESGPVYAFPLNSSSLAGLFKGLFEMP